MSELTFELDADETSVLELKFGQYIKGDKGDTGPKGDKGADGSLKPEDIALIDAATDSAQGSAQAAAGSAQAAANSATSAAASANQARTDGQAAAAQAQASATAAKTSETNAAGSATQASASRDAAAASASASAASSTSANAWQALAQDWAVKMNGLVSGTDYSSKYYAGQSSASAGASAGSAAASAASATQSANSATAAAGSASAAAKSATDAANSAATVDTSTFVALDGSRPMTGALKTTSAYLNMAPGNYRGLWYQSNGSNRWGIGANQTVESGSNAGSDFSIDRYSDSGTWLDIPLTISRTNGTASFSKRPYFAGYTPWDSQNLVNPVRCSTGNTLTFDWGANYAGQIGVKVDSSLMGFMIHSGNVAGQLCYTASHLRTGGGVDTTWNWAGQGGQPTWLWGGNDGASMYVYNPANFSVNYANAAGSVGGVSNPAPTTGATFTGPVNVIANGDPNGYQGTLGAGYFKLNEWNYGPYIDLSRARSEDFQWRIHYNFNNGYLEFIKNGGGSISFTPNGDLTTGNIFLGAMGDWISNTFNGKANNGAQVQWNSGINELAAVSPGSGDAVSDAGAPWMLEGLRCTGGGATWIWPRAIWCRNQ